MDYAVKLPNEFVSNMSKPSGNSVPYQINDSPQKAKIDVNTKNMISSKKQKSVDITSFKHKCSLNNSNSYNDTGGSCAFINNQGFQRK